MATHEFKDSVRPSSGFAAKPAGHAPIEDDITEAGSRWTSGGGKAETVTDKQQERALPDSVKARIDEVTARQPKKAAPVPIEDAPVGTDAPPKEPPVALTDGAAKLAADAPKDDAPADDKPADNAPPATDEIKIPREEHERLVEHNKKLAADLDAERKKPREVAAAHKTLTEAAQAYNDDEVQGVRRYIASVLGIEDPKDKRVDDELRALYTDLTAEVLGVTPDDSHLAKRDAARVRRQVAQQNRERAAEGQTSAERAKADAEAQQAQKATEWIGGKLLEKQGEAKSIADEHPLLMRFSHKLEGLKPSELLYETLRKETAAGTFKLTGNDDADLRAIAKKIETRFQALRDEFTKASPTSPSSTVQPSATTAPTTPPSASKDQRQPKPARTLTSADASVAPAAPPAPKTEATQDTNKRPRFKTDKERKEWALRHIPDR